MNLSQFKPFKQYSFYDDSIYNQIFENVTPSENETLLYLVTLLRYCNIFTPFTVKRIKPAKPN